MGLFNFGKSSTLYFPGCVMYFKFRENFELYKEIFNKLGIDFKIANQQVCCGLSALEAGYESDARKLIKKNFDMFRAEGIKTIITNSSCCYKMLLQNYPEIMPDFNIEVKDIWKIIVDKLSEKPRLIKNRVSEVVSYQDSCYLGRYCGIYDSPRKILELIGYEIKEMPDNKENAFCCGSCGGLPRTNSELANKVCYERILQAKRIGIKKIIVSSIEDYSLMKKNIGNSGIQIIEMSEILADALGIRRINSETKNIGDSNEEEDSVEDLESEEKDLNEKPEEKDFVEKKEVKNPFINQEPDISEKIDELVKSKKQDLEMSDEEVNKIINEAIEKPRDEIVKKISEDFKKGGRK